ncbi:MAG: MFS transporter [Streptosporangiaceae bacterium]|nr:MFS transporter [Streptosporangiaceae bacterium]
MTASAGPGGRRWWALVAISASVLVVGLDLTVLSLALPTISTSLHASTGDLQWISDAYSLVLAAGMLPAGMLGDRYGRKKVLLIALALFGVSSALCAYAATTGELIAARALLGIGAAAIFPLSLSVIPVLFSNQERQRAIALMASATFISYPIGPIVGGYLLDHFWWGSVFLINVPVVILAVTAVALLLPESRSERRPRVDIAGVVISSAGLTALTYGFIKAGQDGWTNAAALAAIGAGAVVLALFVAWERLVGRRLKNPREGSSPRGGTARGGTARGGTARGGTARGGTAPLIELSLFRSAGFRWGTILVTMVTFAMFGLLFAMPQYFQEVQGANALGSGVRLLPMIGGLLAGMIGGTRLQAPRRGAGGELAAPPVSAKAAVTIGFAIMAAAMALGAFTSASTGTGYAAAWIAIAGLGLGLAMPSAMNAALGALSRERSGSGSALISALRQVGATIGVAVLGTLLSNGYGGRLDVSGLPAAVGGPAKSSVAAGVAVAHALHSAAFLGDVRVAFVHGMDIMLWTCGGIALVSAALALAFLPRRAGAAGTQAPAEDGRGDGYPATMMTEPGINVTERAELEG